MRVCLLGGGAREHALGWRLAQSDLVEHLVSAPGNAGLAELGEVVPEVDLEDVRAVVEVARGSDLVVVGPEGPLAAGVVDALEEAGLRAFGPSRAAARLESSKSYAKEIMGRAGVPTAPSRTFHDPQDARRHLAERAGPFVVKADGLAAGKGVLVTESRTEAEAWVDRCLEGDFGEAGRRVVIEDHLPGPELSAFVLCDGREVAPIPPARDYKRLGDGDTGPNTGGMGCYSPVDDLPPGLLDKVVERIMVPVIQQLAADGVAYRGVLYAGLVLTPEGPRVLEFNCRLGDPETQVILPRLEGDLAALLLACVEGALAQHPPRWSPRSAVDVVLAAPGYPESPKTGDPISGLAEAQEMDGVVVFHAGTAPGEDGPVTSGGRVLNVVGTGSDRAEARERAYRAVGVLDFPGKQLRTDIAAEVAG